MTVTDKKPDKATKRTSSRKESKKKEGRAGWLFAAPALALIAVFLLYPFFSAFYISATDQRLISGNETQFVGFENYKNLLNIQWVRLEPLEENGEPILDEDGAFT